MRKDNVSFMSQSCLHFLFIQSLYSFSKFQKMFLLVYIIIKFIERVTFARCAYSILCLLGPGVLSCSKKLKVYNSSYSEGTG